MKLRLKITLCVLLAVCALVSLAVVFGSFGLLPFGAAQRAYLLREYDGCVGVWYPFDGAVPTMLTDIRVRDLPIGEQMELTTGVSAEDYAEVVRLLEDYGR